MSIYEVHDEFRESLLNNEYQASRKIGQSYMRALKRIQDRLLELYSRIEGDDATSKVSWLYERDRLQSLLTQVQFELLVNADVANAVITSSQLDAIELAQSSFLEQVRVSGYQATLDRLPREAFEDLVGFLDSGSPLQSILRTLGNEMASYMQDALMASVASGVNPQTLSAMIRKKGGTHLARLITISRTETMRAYRESSLRSYQAHPDVVGGWMWRSALTTRTCPVCWAMHGTEHTTQERMASHPNCRCTMLPLVRGFPPYKTATGEQAFRGLMVEEQRRILGDAKYNLWRQGKIQLSDLVDEGSSRLWGPFRKEKPLSQIL